VTYAAKLERAEARLDWRRPAVELDRQVRAFAPAPGAWFQVGAERLKLLEAEVLEPAALDPQQGARPPPVPGQVLDARLTVACGQGALRVLRVQRAGKAPLSAADLLRGFPLPAGTKLA